ncbi:MAG: PBP1A family penicillin-binding protein [Deltaproteobacteria bacterium]|nr:PBP1A family penicillin-binding protein [Deltaproteobacteria bacterium]
MKTFLKIISVLILLGCVAAVAGAVGLYFWAARDLPSFRKITDYSPPLVTTVWTGDGEVLGYFHREKRFLVSLDIISRNVPKAFLAAEDSGFYIHEGVDIPGIVRAALKNFLAGEIVQGGSTITQQVIKSLLLTPERSYSRKLKEVILAYRLERYLSKDEILTIYLNQIYFGAGAYGIEAAAREYFAVHASDLTLAQAALLAGLPKAPSSYNPYRNAELALTRQRYVLGRLLELRWIEQDEFDQAIQEELVFKSMADPSWSQGAYYLEEVRRRLVALFGEDEVYTGGLNVYTGARLTHLLAGESALREGLQASSKRRGWKGAVDHLEPGRWEAFLETEEVHPDSLAEGEWFKVLVTGVDEKGADVRLGSLKGRIATETLGWARNPDPSKATENVPSIKDARKVLVVGDVVWASIAGRQIKEGQPWPLALEQEPEVEGALVSIDPRTGEVVSLVGGYDFFRSQFNRTTQARRQPGSGFKPIVYSAAIDKGHTAASVLLDAPLVYASEDLNATWRPSNFEGVFYGPTLLHTALVKSRNLVTIRLAESIGIGTIIERAKALGLDADFPRDLSVSLGSASVTPLNLAEAFTAFARDGTRISSRTILRVDDGWGREIFRASDEAVSAISPQTAFIITSILQEVVQSGTGWRAKSLGRPIAGKTGTTNDERDAWFIGFTPYLLTVVYVGFDDMRPMGRYETGARAALPAWVQYRQVVEDNYPVEDFVKPPGIVMIKVDLENGLLAGPWSKETAFLPFKSGTEPTRASPRPGDADDLPGSGIDARQAAEEALLKQVF